jgi:hypothetical protein
MRGASAATCGGRRWTSRSSPAPLARRLLPGCGTSRAIDPPDRRSPFACAPKRIFSVEKGLLAFVVIRTEARARAVAHLTGPLRPKLPELAKVGSAKF